MTVVSVVIVNWNTRDLLLQTLQTLMLHSEAATTEIIVVDNGSTDGSADAAQQMDDNIKVLRLSSNLGFSVANNRGFEVATGRYVLLLNSDTIVLPSTLPGMTWLLDARPQAACVGARHLNFDRSLQRSMDQPPSVLRDFLFFFGNDILALTGLSRVTFVRNWLMRQSLWWTDHQEERPVGWVNGACMMVRRDVIDQIGPLDESFFIYGEEVDWCHRMRAMGWQVWFTPRAEVVHLGGEAMNQLSSRRVYLKYRGMAHYYLKNEPAKYNSFCRMMRAVAGFRVVAIAAFWFLSMLGVRLDERGRRLLTQERVAVPFPVMLKTWYQIVRLDLKSES